MKNIAFLFCSNYFDKNQPDEDYQEEYNCVKKMGKEILLFSLDGFLEKNIVDIRITNEPTTLIYRGWMLTYDEYTALYQALLSKGFTLINSPEQYRQCHYLPFWYDLLKNNTPNSLWTKNIPKDEEILQLLKKFGTKPLIVKDYVKSRKHEWSEACFIPNPAELSAALQVVSTFRARQAANLVGGVVLREYVSLNLLGNHEKSDMPIAKEVRIFCFRHKPFAYIQYWSGAEAFNINDYQELINQCALLDNNFYTIDLAQTIDNQWIIMEVGDGQVSGLQEYDPALFYEKLFELLS